MKYQLVMRMFGDVRTKCFATNRRRYLTRRLPKKPWNFAIWLKYKSFVHKCVPIGNKQTTSFAYKNRKKERIVVRSLRFFIWNIYNSPLLNHHYWIMQNIYYRCLFLILIYLDIIDICRAFSKYLDFLFTTAFGIIKLRF